MYADSSLDAPQVDAPRQLASKQRAHPGIDGEASDNSNADPSVSGDDEEDGLSIMSMTDDEEEEARLPVRWEVNCQNMHVARPIARISVKNMQLGLCNDATT